MPSVGKTEMLSIDLSVVVIFVIVWVLVLVLSKVYFTPLRRIMGERDRWIQQDKDAAQDAMEKSEQVLEGIEQDLAAAKSAARETRDKWLREAQMEKEKMIDEVSRECRTQVQKAHKELDEKVESLKKELEPRSKNLAERIAKRILN